MSKTSSGQSKQTLSQQFTALQGSSNERSPQIGYNTGVKKLLTLL
jgi:hypothetical protein